MSELSFSLDAVCSVVAAVVYESPSNSIESSPNLAHPLALVCMCKCLYSLDTLRIGECISEAAATAAAADAYIF